MVRRGLQLVALMLLAACASEPLPRTDDGAPRLAARTVSGGFLAAPLPLTGAPALPGSGAFVRLQQPTAIALRDGELLVVDAAAGRIFRIDRALNTLLPLPAAAAAALPSTRVALAADHSAFVLDATARRVLRFARDGRLLQTLRPEPLAEPVDLALSPDAAELWLADATLAQISRLSFASGILQPMRVTRADGAGLAQVGALVATRDGLWLLDRASGALQKLSADGRVQQIIGRPQVEAPASIAVDRHGRLYVAEPMVGRIRVFRDGEVEREFSAAALGVQRIGLIAVDGDELAVVDALVGQIRLLRLEPSR